jgi:hypothetical protein
MGARIRIRCPRLWRRVAAGWLLVASAGCAGTPTVVDLPTGGVDRSLDLYGGFPVVVVGDPFPGMDHTSLTRRVVDAMPRGLGRALSFDAASPADASGRRVVWVFGSIGGGDGSAVCQTAGSAGPQAGTIRVYAAACRGPSALAAVQAEVSAVNSPDDPGFRRLIAEATLELFFPSSNPERRAALTPQW